MTEAELAERIVMQARSVEGADYPITFRSLQRWHQAHNRVGPNGRVAGVAGLIDLRTITNGARNESTPDGHRGASVTRSSIAIDHFFTLYYTQSALTIKQCHRMALRQADKHGWSWSRSYAATRRWVRRTENRSLTCLMRDGETVWRRRYMEHLEVDYTLIAPGDLYVCDHTQCDFWVEYERKQIRPWLTAILDCRSRCIVGWHLGPSPHTDAILTAMLGAFQGWAIPKRMRIDNGKDFTSKIVTGVTKATRDQLRKRYGYRPLRATSFKRHSHRCSESSSACKGRMPSTR